MSHSRTRRARLARRLSQETNLGYQKALQQVEAAAEKGLLPNKLFGDGLDEAIRVLTSASPAPADTTAAPPSASPLAPPERINDLPVLYSKPLPDKPGHNSGHLVLCDRGTEEHDRYVTWIAHTPDGGRTWLATLGYYTSDLAEARADLAVRAGTEWRNVPALDVPARPGVWTDEDYRLSDRVSRDADSNAALAVEQALPAADRQRILDGYRHSNLNGAHVADILGILSDHDTMIKYAEPFYDSGKADEVRAALGWPTRETDQQTDLTRRPSRRALYEPALRRWLISHAVLAVTLLTVEVPDVAAVTGLVATAAGVAAVRWPGGAYLTPDEIRLLGSYRAGNPVIWDAMVLYRKVLRLANLGLVEPVDDGIERTGPAYRITPLGREVLAEHGPAAPQ